VLTATVVFVRVTWFCIILAVTVNYKINTDSVKKTLEVTDSIATYCELLLGIQQVDQMFELYLMIKSSVMHADADNASEKSSFMTERSGVPIFSITTPLA